MLEQQQEKLVNALRDMYDLAERNERWPGLPLKRSDKGFPLTHDILERLGRLKLNPDEHEEPFEEDTAILLRRAAFKQDENTYARVKREENAYPTPATVQSDFSPQERDLADLLPSSSFQPEALRIDQFQFTPPSRTPEEQAFSAGPSLGADALTNYAWPQPLASYPDRPEIWSYDPSQSYNGLGITRERANPCLPTYRDEFGYTGFENFERRSF